MYGEKSEKRPDVRNQATAMDDEISGSRDSKNWSYVRDMWISSEPRVKA